VTDARATGGVCGKLCKHCGHATRRYPNSHQVGCVDGCRCKTMIGCIPAPGPCRAKQCKGPPGTGRKCA